MLASAWGQPQNTDQTEPPWIWTAWSLACWRSSMRKASPHFSFDLLDGATGMRITLRSSSYDLPGAGRRVRTRTVSPQLRRLLPTVSA